MAIRFAFLTVLTGVFAAAIAAQTPVNVPFGKAVLIDGRIDAQEWTDAARHDLANSVTLFVKTDGSHVYLAMRGTKQGWSHVYVNDGSSSDIFVIHASAALGRGIYKQDEKKLWQPQSDFVWEVRERVPNSAVMDAYLAKNGWVASNNNMGNTNEVEYKLSVKSSNVRLAAVFMQVGVPPTHFPVSLADDSLKQKLLEGNSVRDVKFDVTQWAGLNLPSNPGKAVGYWEGAVTREGKTWRVNADIAAASATVDFVDLDVRDVAFPLFVDGSSVRLEKVQPNGRPPVIFDGVVDGDRFSGSWRGLGVTGTFEMKRTSWAVAPPREEEVSFKNGDVVLSGTLLRPHRDARFPAVVITHGSSPNERSAYRAWARRFVETGIAALIYDKRGAGRSTGNTRAASMEDLADDAIAGLVYLKTRADIDGAKIGVVGHSQGGWIAPLAATRSKDVAFVIASAAAGVTPAEQSIYHRAGMMRSEGISEDEIAKATKLREKLYEMNRKILAGQAYQDERAAISQELVANKDARWFGPAELPPDLTGDVPPLGALRLLFFDPIPIWKKVKVPTLAVWGDKDIVVPVAKSRTVIERAQAKNKSLTVRVFSNVDHGNNVVAADGKWDFPRVSKELDQAMVEWIRVVTRAS